MRPSPETLHGNFEPKFGADFSRVRTHTDAQSDRKPIHSGQGVYEEQNLFFRQSAYEPGNRGGGKWIAHELTHVVQQMQGQVLPAMQMAGVEVNDDGALEREADMTRGRWRAAVGLESLGM